MRKSATQIGEEHLSCSFSTKLLKRLLYYGWSKHDRLRMEIRKKPFLQENSPVVELVEWWSWGSGGSLSLETSITISIAANGRPQAACEAGIPHSLAKIFLLCPS